MPIWVLIKQILRVRIQLECSSFDQLLVLLMLLLCMGRAKLSYIKPQIFMIALSSSGELTPRACARGKVIDRVVVVVVVSTKIAISRGLGT